jgi:CHASE2 domain-containing sensor protein
MAIDRAWIREHWPFLVGIVIILVGNSYLYILQGDDWVPGGPPFLFAIVAVLAIEVGRELYRRTGRSRSQP